MYHGSGCITTGGGGSHGGGGGGSATAGSGAGAATAGSGAGGGSAISASDSSDPSAVIKSSESYSSNGTSGPPSATLSSNASKTVVWEGNDQMCYEIYAPSLHVYEQAHSSIAMVSDGAP